MRYFQPEEFHGWYALLSDNLKFFLDEFRYQWGNPIAITPVSWGVGRYLGNSMRYHNVSRWGCVRAVDVMPFGMSDAIAAGSAIKIAERVGFGGIGLYPHWLPRPGLHLDDRETKARWGAIKRDNAQVYVTLERALTEFSSVRASS